MRVSCDPDDPDYVPYPLVSYLKVFLNGIEQSANTTRCCVTMADEENGEIAFYKLADGCDHIFEKADTWKDVVVDGVTIKVQEMALFTAHGKVEIIYSGPYRYVRRPTLPKVNIEEAK